MDDNNTDKIINILRENDIDIEDVRAILEEKDRETLESNRLELMAHEQSIVEEKMKEALNIEDPTERREEISKLSEELNSIGVKYKEPSPLVKKMLEGDTFNDMVKRIKEAPEGYKLPFLTYHEGHGEYPILSAGAITTFVAPSGHGKTTIGFNLAIHYARENVKTVIVNYEESSESIGTKAFLAMSNMSLSRNSYRSLKKHLSGDSTYLDHEVNMDDLRQNKLEFAALYDSKVFQIRDESPRELVLLDYLRRASDNGLKIAILDYVQLIGIDIPGRVRSEELKVLMGGLNRLAVETGMAIIVIAQFNRTVLTPYRLDMRQIAEGSDIEKTSNAIYGLWNTGKPMDKAAMKSDGIKESSFLNRPGNIYISTLKSRDDAGGEALLPFNGDLRRLDFEGSISPGEYELLEKNNPAKESQSKGSADTEQTDNGVEEFGF